jgi:ArsR family transcriptional regulator
MPDEQGGVMTVAETAVPLEVPASVASDMAANAAAASEFLKALSHEGRLMILCHLSTGEKTVTELEDLLGARQAAVSQQLARLRGDGMVTTRRVGKTVFYSISDPRAAAVVGVVHSLFCANSC